VQISEQSPKYASFETISSTVQKNSPKGCVLPKIVLLLQAENAHTTNRTIYPSVLWKGHFNPPTEKERTNMVSAPEWLPQTVVAYWPTVVLTVVKN